LHAPEKGQAYQLAVFSVGAYQEILGDLHNLFGDTHAVHVECEGNSVKVRSIVKGDTISEVLGYVQYEDRELIERIQLSVEDAIVDQRIDHQQAGRIVATFEKALGGYTYLNPNYNGNHAERIELPPRDESSRPRNGS
jgi:arginine decarboxylase